MTAWTDGNQGRTLQDRRNSRTILIALGLIALGPECIAMHDPAGCLSSLHLGDFQFVESRPRRKTND
jgi:hypothetical protein